MDFDQASKAVTELPKRPSNDNLLRLYSLYKQATEGDAKGARPGLLDIKGRAKYDAWKALVGMKAEVARAEYIKLVESLQKGS